MMSGFYLIFLFDLKTIFNINPLQGIHKTIIYSSTPIGMPLAKNECPTGNSGI